MEYDFGVESGRGWGGGLMGENLALGGVVVADLCCCRGKAVSWFGGSEATMVPHQTGGHGEGTCTVPVSSHRCGREEMGGIRNRSKDDMVTISTR